MLLATLAALVLAPQDLEVSDPLVEGLDLDALDALHMRAEETNSDALVILRNGKLVLEETFGTEPGPIESMSVTKSVVSLAVGHLIDAGTIESLDTPVHAFFPEWNQGSKKRITIRHLLTHSSGLQAGQTTEEIYASPDFVQLALCAELEWEPGDGFFYNNKAVNLLAGVVERASGTKLDEYLGEHVFAPLGIEDFTWTRDQAGNPHGMSGLQIRPVDLAKLGQLVLDEGRWGDRQVLSADWVRTSTRAQDLFGRCGFLWWVTPESKSFVIDAFVLGKWREGGSDADFVSAMEPLLDRPLTGDELEEEIRTRLGSRAVWNANTFERNLPDVRVLAGPSRVIRADGYLGQYVVVIPADDLVAVRMIRGDRWRRDDDSLKEFASLVDALVPAP